MIGELKMSYSDEIKHTAPILRDYLNYMLVVKGKSPLTVDEYYVDLRTFFRYLLMSNNLVVPDSNGEIDFEKIDISNIDIELVKNVSLSDVYEYMNFLITERHNKSAARARKSSSLRGFYNYLQKKVYLIKENPMDQLDTPAVKSALPKFLTLEESRILLSVVDGDNRERDYCILTLFLNCGMRLSELCGINISDIRDDNSLRILGKGNKERIVYLNNACISAINVYMAVRPKDGVIDRDALFLSRFKKRISNKTVQHLVKEYIQKAGLDGRGLSTHKLRHTAATLMYQHGNVDIRVLKDMLGHENLGTTEIYTHLSNAQLEEAAKSNPLAEIKPPKNDDKS